MILEEAIKQQHFKSLELRTFLNIYHTHSTLQSALHADLKPYKISVQQFNILRILRGQKGKPVSASEITERMLDKMSNTSRLLEKLRIKELIIRRECPEDRRKVEIELTEKGLELVNIASVAIESDMDRKLGSFTHDELQTLNHLLDKLNTIEHK
ncbi:MAG: MarR family transcriptional regulator [Saprospiraceae bacterium]|nr:MarR family transcriptional regulator [Saprospiraceae bacterium]